MFKEGRVQSFYWSGGAGRAGWRVVLGDLCGEGFFFFPLFYFNFFLLGFFFLSFFEMGSGFGKKNVFGLENEIPSRMLSKVCMYFIYKGCYTNTAKFLDC
uniref:Uncharacterized protein n=1 Tax=Astyanax mexicanus TaxID=7994 RepID=A0A8B9KQF1_ASTMX